MKKLAIAILVAGLGFGGIVIAADHNDGHSRDHEARKRPSPEKMVERMSKKLDLSDEQKQQMLEIMEEQHEKSKTHREALREMRNESKEKMRAILSDEQKEKFAEMKMHRKGKHGKKHNDDCGDN